MCVRSFQLRQEYDWREQKGNISYGWISCFSIIKDKWNTFIKDTSVSTHAMCNAYILIQTNKFVRAVVCLYLNITVYVRKWIPILKSVDEQKNHAEFRVKIHFSKNCVELYIELYYKIAWKIYFLFINM